MVRVCSNVLVVIVSVPPSAPNGCSSSSMSIGVFWQFVPVGPLCPLTVSPHFVHLLSDIIGDSIYFSYIPLIHIVKCTFYTSYSVILAAEKQDST